MIPFINAQKRQIDGDRLLITKGWGRRKWEETAPGYTVS